jgi:TPR repeat protein
MDTNPTAEALVSKADGMVAEGNREGALYLYRQAVDKGSMESALALGRLYDPTEPANSNSTIANAETASYWYAKAAAANIVEAQRRLGILQTRNGLNSSSFAMGIENLKKASDQGDADAAKKLKELGQ